MGNCFVGAPVKCEVVMRGRVLLCKDRLSKRRFTKMTAGFSKMVIFGQVQPDCAKGILVKRELALQFHKGYNVL